MSNFVTDNTTLPFPKSNVRPVGGDPTKWVQASDWNALCQAAVDIRDVLKDPSFNVLATRQVLAGSGLEGGGNLSADVVIGMPDVATAGSFTTANITIDAKGRVVAAASGTSGVPTSRAINTTGGVQGGGDLSADRTLSLTDTGVTAASYTAADITVDAKGRITLAASNNLSVFALVTDLAGYVPTSRAVTTSGGLQGGGALSVDRDLSLTDTGVAAASYTYASITVDAKGRISVASSGAAPVLPSRQVLSSGGIQGGGDLSADRTLSLTDTGVSADTYVYATVTVDAKGRISSAASGAAPVLPSRAINTTGGLQGGGDLSADRTLSLTDTGVSAASYTYATITVDAKGRISAASSGATPALASRNINTTDGIQGGGDLSADRTFSLTDTGVSAASYTYASVTVDAKGRITTASNGATPALASLTITAGNGLSGTHDLSSSFTLTIDTAITVDKTTVQELTNKTLTSPTIQGTVSKGTGLTLPDLAFSASVSAAELLTATNTNAAGLSAVVFKDNSGTSRVSFGYGNASFSDADLRNAFVYLQSSDFTITDAATHFVYVDRANARVGINTNAPATPLDVRGTLAAGHAVRAQNNSATGYSSVEFYNSSGVSKASVGYGNASAATFADLVFFGLATGYYLNLGTSVTAEAAVRVVNTSISGYSSISYYDSSSVVRTSFGYGNASASVAARAGRAHLWVNTNFTITDDTTHFLFVDKTNNRVGINAGTAPTHMLDVRKSITADHVVRVENDSVSGFSSVVFYDSSGVAKGSIGYSNASAFLSGSLGNSSLFISPVTSVAVQLVSSFAASHQMNFVNVSASGYSGFAFYSNTGVFAGSIAYGNASAAAFAGQLFIQPANGVVLNFASTSTGASVARVTNLSASGYSQLDFASNGSVVQTAIGYANASAGGARQSRGYVYVGVNFTFTNDTDHFLFIDQANARVGVGSAGTAPGATFEVKPKVVTTGNPIGFLVTAAAHTGTTAGADVSDVSFALSRTLQHATGAVTLNRSVITTAPTLSFVGASTVTDAVLWSFDDWVKTGTNATVTNTHVARMAPNFNPTAGATKFFCLSVVPTINQTSSASGDYTALYVDVTETAALGTNKLLVDIRVGGSTKFKIDSAGLTTIGNSNVMKVGNTGDVGFYGHAAAGQDTGGEDLTNSVTSGGTTGTIADLTTTVSAASAGADTVDITTVPLKADVEARLATIRNDLYQLARALKQDHDWLRSVGALT